MSHAPAKVGESISIAVGKSKGVKTPALQIHAPATLICQATGYNTATLTISQCLPVLTLSQYIPGRSINS